MTLTKNKMIREIGRRTRLKNREVQVMLEAVIEVWAEELVAGGRIELESHVHRGTTFRIWLPLHQPRPRLLEAPAGNREER